MRLRDHSLHNILVVTNSLPVAHELLATLSSLGVADHNALCEIFVIGGQCRPIAMTVAAPFSRRLGLEGTSTDAFDSVMRVVGRADLAFVGANGLYKREGFANNSVNEI